MSPDPEKTRFYIKVNMAQTLDGHTIEPGGTWALGSKEDKRRMDRLRLWADALITSRQVIANDNPNLFARTVPDSPAHPRPVIVLHNTKTPIRSDRRIFERPHPPGEFWVPESSKITRLEDLIEGVPPKSMKHWQLFSYTDLSEIAPSLAGRGYGKILLEGGPSLNGLFLGADQIDEIYFTLVPAAWGDSTTDRIIQSREPLKLARFRLISAHQRGDEMFMRYKKIRSR